MNTAENWQERVINELKGHDVVLFNPRRDDWDNTIEQSASDPRFSEQVNWELDALNAASLIIMYFDPNTKSPISLLELGLYASKGNMLVCCPTGFWRKGNVEIVCSRYKIPFCDNLDNLISKVKDILTHANVPASKV